MISVHEFHTVFRFIYFSLMFFSSPHYIWFLCFPRFLLAITVYHTSLFWMTLTALGVLIRYFGECPSVEILLFFSYDYFGAVVFLKKTMEVKCYSHHLLARVHTVHGLPLWMPTFIIWVKQYLSIMYVCQVCSSSLRAAKLHKLFGILLHEKCLFPLIYLFNHKFISVWTHGFYFILWVRIYFILLFIFFHENLEKKH